MEKLLSSKLFIFAKCRKDSSPSDHNKPCCYSLVTAPHSQSQSQSQEPFWSLHAKTKNKPQKKTKILLFNPETCYKSFSIKKKFDFMTITLYPKFNQHNLSGPSSGGIFLLETKKQKYQKAKKRGFIFAWNSRILCPCIICVLESTERSSTGGQIRVKIDYKLFKFPRTNGV